MRIRLGIDPNIDTNIMGSAIDAALEASTRAQVPLIANGQVPDVRDAIESGRVRWKPEPPGDEHFDDARTVLKRRWGDCDDFAPWHAAGLRATGEDPEAQAIVYRSGPRRWHAVVQRSDGSIDDPSRWAGMGQQVVGAGAPMWPPMFGPNLGLAAYPFQGGWAGRVDLPDINWPLSWTALSHGLTPSQAVVGAIRGACRVAECAGYPNDLDVMRLHGIDALLCGLDPRDCVSGFDEVGFLPALLPAAMSLASPILSSMGMGGGAPPPAAAPAAPSGGGGGFPGGGGSSGACPIIIRF